MCGIEDYRYRDYIILGSCNGLLYSSQDTTLIVIHPLKKECYEVPPIIINTQHPKSPSWHWWHIRKSIESSCGLGFDDSTNTFKMVCVVPGESEDFLYTMVHVLGTDSWRKIPQVPSSIINGEGVFSNGCLHWLPKGDSCWPVITFEMKAEEFGLIKPPRETPPTEWIDVHLVNLHGQLGFVYNSTMEMQVWVLKERGWVMHCHFEQKPHEYGYLKVLGLWNANGDILVINKKNGGLYVYNLKSKSLCEVSLKGLEQGCVKDTRMYESSLFTTRYTIKENPKEKTLA